jgi:phosphate transport system substrate-binding protein
VSYDAIGSGEGTKQFLAGAVDFGASDAALSDEEMAAVTPGRSLCLLWRAVSCWYITWTG